MSSVMADMPKYVSEFVGTYILVLTIGCNVLGGTAVWAVTSNLFVTTCKPKTDQCITPVRDGVVRDEDGNIKVVFYIDS